MVQTAAGIIKMRETLAQKKAEDPDYFRKLGAKGGAAGRTGGFYNNPELASRAGAIGGKVGKRGKAVSKKETPSANQPLAAQSDEL